LTEKNFGDGAIQHQSQIDGAWLEMGHGTLGAGRLISEIVVENLYQQA
jgi:hypothetical protein